MDMKDFITFAARNAVMQRYAVDLDKCIERQLHTEKRIADKQQLQKAREYYDMYADSRSKPFAEIDLAAYVTSSIILMRMGYDVEHMFSLFETARLYWGREC